MTKKDWVKCILCDDSRNVIKRIPDNSIDFILTDPPYNIGKHSTGNIPLPGRSPLNNDVADWDLIDFFPEEWSNDFIRILKPNGNLFIFTSYNQIGRWYNELDHRFDTTNFMIWHKTNPAPKIFKAGFLNSCEMIFTCWNKGHTWNFISQAEMHNFFESTICMKPERLTDPKHPAQKPVALLKKIISIASNPDDIIFDPFMGVGSTGVAALELGRKFIGVEVNPKYFNAAKVRIENEMSKRKNHRDVVEEPIVAYQQTLFSQKELSCLGDTDVFEDYISTVTSDNDKYQLVETGLKPIIKWAGGKEKELKYIIPNLPSKFCEYYEPFVGGGSVFMAIPAKKYHINDFSSELIALYRYIANQDKLFFQYVNQIDTTWKGAFSLFIKNAQLFDKYIEYRNNDISDTALEKYITDFCKQEKDNIISLLDSSIAMHHDVLISEMQKNLLRKLKRMKDLELSKHLLPDKDIADNIETAFKGTFYMYFRYLYNDNTLRVKDPALHCALFFFIRNYCYSGMFRYNDNGEFNVPYGGIAYNSKTMDKKIEYYHSVPLLNHFSYATIDNLDFECFLRKFNPKEDDFVFLDPPYDSEFSTYAQNEFTKDDQRRLAEYMINECKAKWMLIIKYTDFIYNLYNQPGIVIRTFDKEYLVSFMNRNDKKTTHLLITNY